MHTGPVNDATDGKLDEPAKTDCECRRCKQTGTVTWRTWESHCGGYEDLKFDCSACGATWWVEGPDA